MICNVCQSKRPGGRLNHAVRGVSCCQSLRPINRVSVAPQHKGAWSHHSAARPIVPLMRAEGSGAGRLARLAGEKSALPSPRTTGSRSVRLHSPSAEEHMLLCHRRSINHDGAEGHCSVQLPSSAHSTTRICMLPRCCYSDCCRSPGLRVAGG